MPRTAYVVSSDRASYQVVTDYLCAQEVDVNDFYPGSTYRDQFKIPAGSTSGNSSGSTTGVYFPVDSADFVGGGLTAQPQKARVSDEVNHTPPRDNRNRQTRLRFFAGVEYTFTVDTSDDVLILPAGMELSVGSVLALTSAGTLPAGLAASTLYYVIAASALRVKLSTTPGGSAVNITDAGTGVHTARSRVVIADFKPEEWSSWSNTKPTRF